MYRGSINVGTRARTLDVSPEFDSYSKVIIQISETVSYEAGTDVGRVLRLECPWGTPQMAQDILDSLRGFQYQPYNASSVELDPAAEIGDGITIGGTYSGIYNASIIFGSLYVADITAPEGEALDNDTPYVSASDRKVKRQFKETYSELAIQSDRISAEVTAREKDVKQLTGRLDIQADEISAKVSKTGGDASSFGWVLDEKSWTIQSNGSTILKATKDGLEVKGKIVATSGTIGGFAINTDSISYNNQTWGGTNSQGIYIGPNGIQLGKNFKVDSNGNLAASSGTFSGYVKAGNVQYGGSNGTFDGYGLTSGTVTGGWGGAIGGSTITTANTGGGINTSLGYADFSNGVFNGWNSARDFSANLLNCVSIFRFKGENITFRYIDGYKVLAVGYS